MGYSYSGDQIRQAGGMSGNSTASDPLSSFSIGVGSWFNNLSGTTQQNIFNSEEAEKNRVYNSEEAEKARVYNSAEALKNRQWQTEMSNTAYQRAVADMKAAGINPASLGGNASASPASTPSGSAASNSAASGSAASNGSGNNGFMDAVKAGISLALYKKSSNSTESFKRLKSLAKVASSFFGK